MALSKTGALRSPPSRPYVPVMTLGAPVIFLLLYLCSFNSLTQFVKFGSTNLNVVITTAIAPLTVAMVLVHGRIAKAGLTPLARYGLFLCYTLISLFFASQNLQSFQNTAMYLVIGGVALVSFQSAASCPGYAKRLIGALKRMVWLATLLYIAITIVTGVSHHGVFAARTYALLAVAGTAIYVAEAKEKTPFAVPKAILFCLLCLMTVSRSASATALIILATVWLDVRNYRSWLFTGLLVALAIGTYMLIIVNVDEFRASFTGGDEALRIGSVAIDTKGRGVWWALLWQSFLQSPLLGHGPGSAQLPLIASIDLYIQPHNDHLRLLHDFGIVGYALWWSSISHALYTIVRGSRLTAATDRSQKILLTTAMLYIGAFIAVMITDNVLIYLPVAIPFAVLLGSGVAVAGRLLADERCDRLHGPDSPIGDVAFAPDKSPPRQPAHTDPVHRT